MPTIPNLPNAIQLGDRRLIRAFPEIAKLLTEKTDEIDRAGLDGFLKLLPAAIDRYEAQQTVKESLDPAIYNAINSLATSFSGQPVSAANSENVATSNIAPLAEEATEDDNSLDNQQGAEIDPTYSLTKLVTSELVSDSHPDLGQVTRAAGSKVTRVSQKPALANASTSTSGRSRVRTTKGIVARRQASGPVIED